MMTLDDVARIQQPCDSAQAWARAQPDQSLGALWSTCPRGDWLLWLAEVARLNVRVIGYWCAERARQAALRALTEAGVECGALRACAPIVDAHTARAAAAAAWAAAAAAWAAEAAAWAARATAEAAEAAAEEAWAAEAWAAEAWAAAAAAEAWAAAAAAEHQAIADHVRAEITYAQIETGLRARLEVL